MASVLLCDAAVHVYWATGAVWPADDSYDLSRAVLGFGSDFRPGLVLPLAGLLIVAAGLVLARGRLGRAHRLGWLWQLGTLAITAGLLTRGLLGLLWCVPALGHTPGVFYWMNLLVYTPMCLGLAGCGLRLLGAGAGRSAACRPGARWSRTAAAGAPVAVVTLALLGAFAFSPTARSRDVPTAILGQAASAFVDTPLARFHHVKQGSGSPVVFLSPGSSWAAAWTPQLTELSAEHTVYVVDLPGQGYTELHDREFTFDLNGMTRAIDTYLDAVGLPRTVLAGNSWSGGWALAYAQSHPDRVDRLMLLAPSGADRPDPVEWEILKLPVVGLAMAQLGSSSLPSLESAVRGLLVNPDKVSQALINALAVPSTFPDNVRATHELEARLDWSETQRAMPRTTTPTLVLWGSQDSILPVEYAATFEQRLPAVRLHVLDGCGHGLPLDCPSQVNAHMREFLRGY
ncbi:alpha/beta fold hydrolase [Actinomadura sp. 7K507]|uniref:alpha/beta fold hydrolase n=1 Tax=Actinomadura sp. 7K507 TaxID=2530365 RepID=UPI001052F37D|nr:alpha/beta fold hydrolase [Actinomadura sp. 7K507]TDC92501.1 alpha/beta fold hydrolase [Actinomadura sp. 7K507]